MELLITGATGFTGTLFMKHLANLQPNSSVNCLIRHTSNYDNINSTNLNINYIKGDSSNPKNWEEIFEKYTFSTIIQIVSIRHIPVILESLNKIGQSPRLIVIGTTGVYSKYNHYSGIYKDIENQLKQYQGSYCLLRPTMIYGSHRDKNLHKLIKFCDRYGFFPVFGAGDNLVQPVHAEDLAQALLTALQRPHIQGAYDLSGGTVVTFRE
ncbi:MAG: NAD-dependent epimerase/dehydratase family protein, partial [Planktothrix sp.]